MDDNQKRSLGSVVRALREARGLTRQDLVERTGEDPSERVSMEMLAKVEQGKKAPSSRTLRRLAIGLGMEPTDLAHRAAWWELNELNGASASLLRLGITQGAAVGAISPRLGVLGRVAAPLVGAAAVGGLALGHDIADRKKLAAWLREQARLVAEAPENDVPGITEALGHTLLETAQLQTQAEPPATQARVVDTPQGVEARNAADTEKPTG